MATATNSSGDLISRALALILGVAILFYMFLTWGDEFSNLFSSDVKTAISSSSQPVENTSNPALDACLAKRIGDVDKMKAEGIINDSQYEAFSSRARELCLSQNPSG